MCVPSGGQLICNAAPCISYDSFVRGAAYPLEALEEAAACDGLPAACVRCVFVRHTLDPYGSPDGARDVILGAVLSVCASELAESVLRGIGGGPGRRTGGLHHACMMVRVNDGDGMECLGR